MALKTAIYEAVVKEGAELDWGFNWKERGWLSESPGDVLDDAAWEISPSTDVTLDNESLDADAGTTTTFVRGLTAGTDYLLTVTVTLLPSGRKDVRTMRLRCRA